MNYLRSSTTRALVPLKQAPPRSRPQFWKKTASTYSNAGGLTIKRRQKCLPRRARLSRCARAACTTARAVPMGSSPAGGTTTKGRLRQCRRSGAEWCSPLTSETGTPVLLSTITMWNVGEVMSMDKVLPIWAWHDRWLFNDVDEFINALN